MKMLKSKNIRRICVLLAMLAPVVYLFGSLFAGLTGAHGNEIFAEGYSEDYSLEVSVIRNTWINGETGVFYTENGATVSDYIQINSDFVHVDVNVAVDWVYYFNSDYSFNRRVRVESTVFNLDNAFSFAVFGVYSGFSADNWIIYFPDTSVLPSVTADSFSDYVFGQFFAKDNFLVEIGKDVLSETPHGFAPFASFWKYLDDNMLHMGDMQLGLMGYGYVYYCCHVLLFDIAFILVTFFLDFIQKVNDKVVGGVD